MMDDPNWSFNNTESQLKIRVESEKINLGDASEFMDTALELRQALSVSFGRMQALDALVRNLEAIAADAP